jgi:hydrogenase maturation protein HypF
MTATVPLVRTACRVRVRGVVQGVGFRPFIHRLALRHQLAGWVKNASGDVQLALEGPTEEITGFLSELRTEAPPLASIELVEVESAVLLGLQEFAIEESTDQADRRLPVPPDVALCPACERELLDPANRRYHYPFITCTDCGPRFTVIEKLPYDRERTTMRAFTQCPACEREYRTPGDRRHHSETNSCPECGPALWLEVVGGTDRAATERPSGARSATRARGSRAEMADGADRAATERPPGARSATRAGWSRADRSAAVLGAARLLQQGRIVAIRGFGGYHLACDATNEAAVAELRRRKAREAKPFAVMVRSLADARRLATLSELEAGLLEHRERPVLLLKARPDHPLAPGVAPGLDTVGVMLPSTPVHLLLLEAVGRPLVMTSGNRSEEPIAIGNEEARDRLGSIADAFLMHDREILSRCDDSVLRTAAGQGVFLRRARGFAPLPLRLPLGSPVPLLAVGPHLKNTFTLVHGDQAWVSPHIGDLESLEGLDHFRHTLGVYRRLFRIEPEAVVHDLHPGYLSTRLAIELGLPTTLAVQHHHAHIAAVMSEYGLAEPVIGVAYDGTGHGLDGAVWGAELLAGDLTGFRRLGHLRYAPLPGGDLAARRPWRAALGYASVDSVAWNAILPTLSDVPAAELAVAERQLATKVNAPVASSMGRLFDAAAAIIGIRTASAYEGQAAMELEALAGGRIASEHPFPLEDDGAGGWQLDPIPLLTRLALRRQRGADPGDLAADFHASVARATEVAVWRAAEATGIRTVALGGGVFQNARLLGSLRSRLERRGYRVLVPRTLSPNDGAVSYGQAAMAAAILSLRR